MSLEDACAAILGDEAAAAVMLDMGLQWTVVAAMAAARPSDDPAALAAIDKHIGKERP